MFLQILLEELLGFNFRHEFLLKSVARVEHHEQSLLLGIQAEMAIGLNLAGDPLLELFLVGFRLSDRTREREVLHVAVQEVGGASNEHH